VLSGGRIVLDGPTNVVLEKLRPQPANPNVQPGAAGQPTPPNRVS